MRFVNPNVSENTPSIDKRNQPQKRQLPSDDDEDEDFDYDGPSWSAAPCPPNYFSIPAASLPSFGSRQFNFRWRGEETGEGEIQLDADEDLCSLTFESPNALSGIFISGLTDKIEFQGFKTELDPEAVRNQALKRRPVNLSDPRGEWRSRSGTAYEMAATGRWGPVISFGF